MATTDYQNRKYDFLGFRGAKATGDQRLDMALYSETDSGQICVGVQKLAQRWSLEFFTELGGLRGLPDRGSDFITALNSNTLRSENDIFTAFALTDLDIARQLQNEEYAGMPDDERFVSATLTSVIFYPGYLNMHVLITSRAGDTHNVILPIATLP